VEGEGSEGPFLPCRSRESYGPSTWDLIREDAASLWDHCEREEGGGGLMKLSVWIWEARRERRRRGKELAGHQRGQILLEHD
jgi:hypothetical protein